MVALATGGFTIGIISYGVYIPFNRLQRSVIASALDIRAGKGERSVASYDEDTATLAVEAARNCLAGRRVNGISSLLLATTRPPYQEKLNAATVHAALQLEPATRALDLGGSVRAGLGGLLAASDTASLGHLALATMADIRFGLPESKAEQEGGDGAAAFLLGRDDVIAEIEATYSETLEHLAVWRLPGEEVARNWEERFGLEQVYLPLLDRAFRGLLEKTGTAPEELTRVVIDAPLSKVAPIAIKKLRLPAECLVGTLGESVGHTGAAHAGILMAAALDAASPGDRIAVFSVSDGVDSVLLRVTEKIASYKSRRSVEELIASKRSDLSYQQYLKWRGLLASEPPRRPEPDRPAGPPSLRSSAWKFGFVGSRCKKCGTNHLPPQVVCMKCRVSGEMEAAAFADEKAIIKTFTADRIAYTPQPPMIAAVLDFEGSGRFQCELTDCVPEKLAIGQEVEMTFRRLYTAGGIHNYFWKGRPVR